MTPHNHAWKLTSYAVLFVLLFFGLLQVTLQARGKVFALEALGALVLALFVFAGGLTYDKGKGEKLFFAVFVLVIANLLFLRAFTGDLYVVMPLFALVGVALGFPRRCAPRCYDDDRKTEEPHSVVFDPAKNGEEKKVGEKGKMEQEVKTETKNTATFSPGKYVASSKSNVFHEARCDWAKKVSKTHQLWFSSKKEAEEKKYKPHGCVN